MCAGWSGGLNCLMREEPRITRCLPAPHVAAAADTACIDVPKVALVSTLSSVSPAPPFVFRNYNLPPASEALARQIGAHAGSCKHPVWQAVRASSAASFFLEPFSCGGDKFQDGAVVANK